MTEQDLRELMDEQTERLTRTRPQLTWKVVYAPAMANGSGVNDRVIVHAWAPGQPLADREHCMAATFINADSQDAVIDAMAAVLEQRLIP